MFEVIHTYNIKLECDGCGGITYVSVDRVVSIIRGSRKKTILNALKASKIPVVSDWEIELDGQLCGNCVSTTKGTII